MAYRAGDAPFWTPTFWVRGGQNLWCSARSREQDDFLALFTMQWVVLHFVSIPVWTLDRGFSLEEMTLFKDGPRTSVSFANGYRHGSWPLTPWGPARRNATFLDIAYTRGEDPRLGDYRERTFELKWGNPTFVKRPDAEGDTLERSQSPIPTVTPRRLYLEIPPYVDVAPPIPALSFPRAETGPSPYCATCYGNGTIIVHLDGTESAVQCPHCFPPTTCPRIGDWRVRRSEVLTRGPHAQRNGPRRASAEILVRDPHGQ